LKFFELHFPVFDPGSGQNIAAQIFKRHRTDVAYMLQLFSQFLELSHSGEDKELREHIAEVFPGVEFPKDKPFFAVVIEYAETLAPPNSTEGEPPDRNALVTFLVWARNKRILRANNFVIFIAESTASVAPAMRSQTNGIVPIELPFPDVKERERVFDTLLEEHKGRVKIEVPPKTLSRLSAGMTRRGISQLICESAHLGLAITERRIFEEKKRIIEVLSGGLLEVKRPLWGREVIGGLEPHKRYIGEVILAMRRGDILAVPMGIMLLGPPGTGKTVFAEALAYEAGIQMLVLKNTRQMWVGSSERNLDFSLKLIIAHEPALVFVDEVDQQFQARGGIGDNTGVNQRMQGTLFEFMSNTAYRGKVLWIAASNRPDLLDPAMKREGRFDEKIPFFPPNAEERAAIVPALLTKLAIQAKEAELRFEYRVGESFFGEFGWSLHRHMKPGTGLVPCDPDLHSRKQGEADDEVGFTGAEIEAIIQKAYKFASAEGVPVNEEHLRRAEQGYIPTRDVAMYNWMTDLALLECNSEHFMPDRWRKRARLIRSQRSHPPASGLGISNL
ncbi:MAG: ATP-binding protein, partial [bacterium]|nr:ATP-binding protein [bacterium]